MFCTPVRVRSFASGVSRRYTIGFLVQSSADAEVMHYVRRRRPSALGVTD